MALDERGQRLGEAEETSAAMMASAENFAKHAHEVVFHTSNYTFHFIYLFTGYGSRSCFVMWNSIRDNNSDMLNK